MLKIFLFIIGMLYLISLIDAFSKLAEDIIPAPEAKSRGFYVMAAFLRTLFFIWTVYLWWQVR